MARFREDEGEQLLDHASQAGYMASQPPNPPPNDPRSNLDLAFQALVASSPIHPAGSTPASNFVKRVAVPRVQIMSASSKMKDLTLSKRGLIGQFSRI